MKRAGGGAAAQPKPSVPSVILCASVVKPPHPHDGKGPEGSHPRDLSENAPMQPGA